MFNIKENRTKIEFQISSEMINVDRIVREVREFLQQLGMEVFSEFKVVLRELLINAIEHGNKNQEQKKVVCIVDQLEAELFRVQVKDQGNGFAYKDLDMSMPEDPENLRNRGYALIKAFTEDIKFNKKGNQITAYVKIGLKTGFDVTEVDGWQVIYPSGDITAAVADEFRVLLNELVRQGNSKYRFDLSRVQDLDSISLSVLIVLSKMLNKKVGKALLEIINAKPDLLNLFRITRLDRIYQISGAG